MKKVLISIHPRWCAEIFNGQKTIEVRKSFPRQLETPFEVLVYCTKGKENEKMCFDRYSPCIGNGKVIGEFVCDRVRLCIPFGLKGHLLSQEVYREMCLSKEQLDEYGGLKTLYSWHITEPKLFDKPKELGEFRTIKCTNKKGSCSDCKIKPDCIKYLTRPPQSWCYVEELQ